MRTPPNAIDTEKALLGSLLMDGDSIELIRDIITPDSFYKPTHCVIYQAMIDLDKELSPIDIVSVTEKLKQSKKLQDIGGQEYLINLAEITPSAANIVFYAKIVADKKTNRDVLLLMGTTSEKIYRNGITPEQLITELKHDIEIIETRKSDKKIETVSQSVSIVNEVIDQKIKTGAAIVGIPTGMHFLDRYFGGFVRGKYYLCGARGGTGKTTLIWNAVCHAAEHGHGAAVISLEMNQQELLNKRVSAKTGIPLTLIEKHPEKLTPRDRERINSCLSYLSKLPLYIDDSKGIAYSNNIIKSINHLVREKGVELIAIDHISRFRDSVGKRKLHEFHKEFSGTLEKMADEMNFALVLLSQLNENGTDRTEFKPSMKDIRESQAYQEDPDGIFLIYRKEKVYHLINKKNTEIPDELRGQAEIFIVKNRGGDEGRVKLRFNGVQSRFEEDEPQYTEPTIKPSDTHQYSRDVEEDDELDF